MQKQTDMVYVQKSWLIIQLEKKCMIRYCNLQKQRHQF